MGISRAGRTWEDRREDKQAERIDPKRRTNMGPVEKRGMERGRRRGDECQPRRHERGVHQVRGRDESEATTGRRGLQDVDPFAVSTRA